MRLFYLVIGCLALVTSALGGIVLIAMTYAEDVSGEELMLQHIAGMLTLLVAVVSFGNLDRLKQGKEKD